MSQVLCFLSMLFYHEVCLWSVYPASKERKERKKEVVGVVGALLPHVIIIIIIIIIIPMHDFFKPETTPLDQLWFRHLVTWMNGHQAYLITLQLLWSWTNPSIYLFSQKGPPQKKK